MSEGAAPARLRSAEGRAIVAAAVLGSGAVFVESTVVNVALPAMAESFGLGMTGLQWIVNGYLITLSALLLLGGALGDVAGQRRIFRLGLITFSVSSVVCALAPTFTLLVGARLLQGAAGALLVPTSLAFLDTTFAHEDRSEAIGRWAGWSAVSTAAGPLLGGVLVDLVSWRWVFAAVCPLPLLALLVMRGAGKPAVSAQRRGRVDYLGAVLVSVGLGALVWALLTASERGGSMAVWMAGASGLALLVLFIRHLTTTSSPLLPPGMFAVRAFTGANVATLLIYAALSALMFLLMVQLQSGMGYAATTAGASLLPINALMLVLSPVAGRWAARSGARWPIAGGALLAACGLGLFAGVPGSDGYVTGILPAVTVFGAGLGLLVAPLTSAVLAAADEERAGVASAINNATARVAGLLATVLIPMAAGLGGLDEVSGRAFAAGFSRAMWWSAALCAGGGVVAWFTVVATPEPTGRAHPAPTHGCVPGGAVARPTR